MSLFRQVVRAYAIDRLLRGGRRRSAQRSWRYGPPPRMARRSRGRTGFYGPFPYHTRRTRGGSRVTVSGCCLPIPLTLVLGLGTLARLALHRRAAQR